jgi:hypothetical protein
LRYSHFLLTSGKTEFGENFTEFNGELKAPHNPKILSTILTTPSIIVILTIIVWIIFYLAFCSILEVFRNENMIEFLLSSFLMLSILIIAYAHICGNILKVLFDLYANSVKIVFACNAILFMFVLIVRFFVKNIQLSTVLLTAISLLFMQGVLYA